MLTTRGTPARALPAGFAGEGLLKFGMFETTPLMRSSSGDCGFVMALCARGFESCPRSQVVLQETKTNKCQKALSSHSQSCVCLPVRPWPAHVQIPARPTISGNFSVDLYGPVDTGPGTYGHADYVIWNQTFQNVPARCRVQILHISGDFFAWPAGTTLVGASAGVLVAANRSDPLLADRHMRLRLPMGFFLVPARDDGERDSDSD